MSESPIDPSVHSADDKAEERPAQPESGPADENKPRNELRPPERKRPNWLRLSRVKEPGAPPRSLSVWLGRLRRKKP